MNYCSLEDAFQAATGCSPVPGRTENDAGKQARKEERRRARRCKGPAATFLDPSSNDPDRQHLTPPDDVPAMNPTTGLMEYGPVTSESVEPFEAFRHTHTPNPEPPCSPDYDKDELEKYAKKEMRSHYIAIPTNGNGSSVKKKFFGATGPTDEPYADYTPDEKDYRLQPDFTGAFASPFSAGATSTLPIPSVHNSWKPITPSGAQTAFIEHLPPPGGKYRQSPSSSLGSSNSLGPSTDEIMKKLDMLYAKLERMNHSTPEQLTSEMLMFISSGIFVLFLMDLMVKRGSRMRF